MADVKKKPTPRKRSTAAKDKVAASKTKAKTTTARKKTATTAKTKSTGCTKATKKAAPKASTYEPHPIEYTPEGFQVGSDSAIIATTLVNGATTRGEINELAIAEIEATNGLQTRSGKDKYVPSMVSSILSRMLATGEYEVHASWQLVPVEKKTSRRKK